MKIFFLLIISHIFFFNSILAQCPGSPFCANQGAVTFPAGVNTSAAAGPDYGCLFTQPNPAWYYFQVSQSGTIVIDIAGTGGGDVDFVCWGPFANLAASCNGLTSACTPNCPTNVGSPGFYPSGNMADCSYSASNTETCTITNAVTGQYYVLLITNFSGLAQNITFNQTSGTGSTNCGLLSSGVTSQTVCTGSTATLTANTNILNPSFLWSPGGATTQSIIVTPSVTTVYSVAITGTNSATNTSTTVVNTGTATILAPFTPTISSNTPVCIGSSLNLSTNSGSNYLWSGPLGFTSIIQNPTIASVTNSMAGVYSVTVTNSSGCVGSTALNISISPSPSVSLGSNSPICAGSSLSLTATSGATSYVWNGPNSFTSPLQNPTINSVMSSGVYSLTSTLGLCSSVNTISVLVVPLAPITLTPIPTVCNGNSINLMAPAGGTSYLWSGPNSFTSSMQNPTIINASLVNQGMYTLSVTTGSCLSTGTISINVYNPITFAAVPTSTILCEGKTGHLLSLAQGGSGVYIYSWSPSIGLSSINTASTTVTGSITLNYSVTIADINCPSSPSISQSALVTVNPIPQITMSTSDNRGCEPFCTNLISTSIPTSTNCVWRFSNNSGTVNCNQGVFCFPVHGSYGAVLTVTDINGCVDSISQNAFVIVDPKPYPDFSWSPGNPTILVNQVSFFDESLVGAPMQSWAWNFGDYFLPANQNNSTIKNPTHVYENIGSYDVSLMVTNSFGCKDTVTKTLTVEDDLVLYIPNAFSPSEQDDVNDVFKIQGTGFLTDTFEMFIYDRWGTLVFKTNDVTKGWDGSIKGGAKAIQGVYVYKIKLKDFRLKDKQYVGHITLL